MKRTVLVLGVMVVGITLMLWAGWHNLRERKLALEKAQENRAVLIPDKDKAPAGGQDGSQATGDSSSELHLKGKQAPAFTLVDLAGKKVSLSDYKGRPVVVNFWATWCAPCKVEMPWFEEFQMKYAPKGLAILGIAEDDAGKDAIAKSAKKLGVSYPILLTDGKVAPRYGGVDYLPTSFYVDRSGIVQEETAGLGSKDEIEANIAKIVAGAEKAPAAMVMTSTAGAR